MPLIWRPDATRIFQIGGGGVYWILINRKTLFCINDHVTAWLAYLAHGWILVVYIVYASLIHNIQKIYNFTVKLSFTMSLLFKGVVNFYEPIIISSKIIR